jgi:YVTN family beta-propeller protein
VANVTVGIAPAGVMFDGKHLWVANLVSNNVTELDTAGNLLGTFAVGTSPSGLAFDGTHVWVSNISSSTVTRLSP